jgi:hypothetical protein
MKAAPKKGSQFISDADQTSSPLTMSSKYSMGSHQTSKSSTGNNSMSSHSSNYSNHSTSNHNRHPTIKPAPAVKPAAPVHANGTDSPRPAGSAQPGLAANTQSYNELLDKYCFFGSVKSSPTLKEGTLRSGQYDGSNEDGYMVGSPDSSADSTADNSPLMMEKKSPPRTQNASTKASRSASPAPMTGFVSGTSPMYHHLRAGFPFHDTHAATAIRG